MIAFVMGCGRGLMGVCGLVMKFGGRVVWAGHGVVLRPLDAASWSGEPFRLSAHPSAIHRKDGAGDIVAGGRTEIKSRAGEILRLSPARSGDAFEDLPVARFVRLQGFG